MENLHQGKQTTLLDLNIYALDAIFKALKRVTDKVNLARAHPHLTESFGYHGRLQFKQLYVHLLKEQNLSFILEHCGEHVQIVEIATLNSSKIIQLIADNCANLNKLRVSRSPIPSSLEIKNWEMNKLSGNIIKLIRNCKKLRTLELYENDCIDAHFIRSLLKILVANGVTPDARFTLALPASDTNSNILTMIYSHDIEFNLLNVKLSNTSNYDKPILK